jgi:hypothetical protein
MDQKSLPLETIKTWIITVLMLWVVRNTYPVTQSKPRNHLYISLTPISHHLPNPINFSLKCTFLSPILLQLYWLKYHHLFPRLYPTLLLTCSHLACRSKDSMVMLQNKETKTPSAKGLHRSESLFLPLSTCPPEVSWEALIYVLSLRNPD